MLIAKVKGSHLAAALGRVTKIRQTNSVLPITEMVLCKTMKGGLTLTCTNLDASITTGIKCETEIEKKEFMIPLKVQLALQHLKDVETIEIYNGKALSFKYGENVINVPAENPDNFPKTEAKFTDPIKFKVEDTLLELLQVHRKFCSSDDMRPSLCGVQVTDKTMASTDAHRLALSDITIDGYEGEPFSVVVSKNFITAVTTLAGVITINLDNRTITANDKHTKVTARLIDANFPDVKVVIPNDNGTHIELDRLELLSNVKLALNMSDKATKMLRLGFEGEGYELSACDKDLTEEIKLKGSCRFVQGDERFEIGLNGSWLLSQLELLSAEMVTIEGSKANKPILFKEENKLFLLMPLHLD